MSPLLARLSSQTDLPGLGAYLLGQSCLRAGEQLFGLEEVELYLYDPVHHPDPYAHRNPLQQTRGRWVFHHAKDRFRGGSFKGLDISFGPERSWGGILIRTLSHWSIDPPPALGTRALPESVWAFGGSLITPPCLTSWVGGYACCGHHTVTARAAPTSWWPGSNKDGPTMKS